VSIERWGCGSIRTVESGPKCAQSWNPIQTLKEYFSCHIYCAQLRAHLGKIVEASCAVSNRRSRYPPRNAHAEGRKILEANQRLWRNVILRFTIPPGKAFFRWTWTSIFFQCIVVILSDSLFVQLNFVSFHVYPISGSVFPHIILFRFSPRPGFLVLCWPRCPYHYIVFCVDPVRIFFEIRFLIFFDFEIGQGVMLPFCVTHFDSLFVPISLCFIFC